MKKKKRGQTDVMEKPYDDRWEITANE